MKLLDLLKRGDKSKIQTPEAQAPKQLQEQEARNDEVKHHPLPEIPEETFVEYSNTNQPDMEPNESQLEVNDIQTLYRYLEQNLEKKGYEDALMNPDTSYMEEHIRFLQNELNITISKVNTYYRQYMRLIDFHIDTRKRQEMIEVVDELLTKKANVEDEMKVVAQIENDARNANGITQNLVLSYKKGFRNGFSAITYGTILTRKL